MTRLSSLARRTIPPISKAVRTTLMASVWVTGRWSHRRSTLTMKRRRKASSRLVSTPFTRRTLKRRKSPRTLLHKQGWHHHHQASRLQWSRSWLQQKKWSNNRYYQRKKRLMSQLLTRRSWWKTRFLIHQELTCLSRPQLVRKLQMNFKGRPLRSKGSSKSKA